MRKKALLLAIILIISSFAVSCGDKNNDQSEIQTGSNNLVPHLGKRNLEGYTLKILSSFDNEPYGKEQFAPTEQNGEAVNDAVYNRNSLIELEYNCKIDCQIVGSWDVFADKVKNDLLAETCDYDFISTGIITMSTLVTEGYLKDIYTLPNSNLKLDKPWWDNTTNSQMSLGHKLYFATGDVLLLDDESTSIIFFNKDMIAENQLDNPYDLVHNNKWTIDKMHEMAKAVSSEAGDGTMDVTTGDTWGFVGAAFDCYKLVLGCGTPMVTKNSDDLPVISVTEQKNIDAFVKSFDFITDKMNVAYIEEFYAWNNPDAYKVQENFYTDKALFFANSIRSVNTPKMRDADIRYGIIPMPKLSENQDKFACMVDPYRFYVLSVPDSGKVDTDKATFVMEAMAYLGREKVTPKYYDLTLKTKRFQDNDSPEMLDLIMSNRIIDLAVVFNWNDCIQYYNTLVFSKSNSIASFMEANGPPMQAAMDTTIEALKKLD